MSCHVVAALPEFGFFLVLVVVGGLKRGLRLAWPFFCPLPFALRPDNGEGQEPT